MYFLWKLDKDQLTCVFSRILFVSLVGFLTSSSTTRLYCGRVPRLTSDISDNFTCCHTRDMSRETMTQRCQLVMKKKAGIFFKSPKKRVMTAMKNTYPKWKFEPHWMSLSGFEKSGFSDLSGNLAPLMTSVSASHIILTLTQPVVRGQPQRGSNPGSPHQELCTLPTELLRPPFSRIHNFYIY